MNKFATKPWYNFLTVSDLTEKEILPLRVKGELAECQRCFIPTQVASELDTKLTNYVCKSCRLDDQEWDTTRRIGGIAYTIGAMEADIKQYEAVTGASATDAN
jgi:hypothetical protein